MMRDLGEFAGISIQNIVAKPGHSNCFRLSIKVQHLGKVKKNYRLPRTVFAPEPKVKND